MKTMGVYWKAKRLDDSARSTISRNMKLITRSTTVRSQSCAQTVVEWSLNLRKGGILGGQAAAYTVFDLAGLYILAGGPVPL